MHTSLALEMALQLLSLLSSGSLEYVHCWDGFHERDQVLKDSPKVTCLDTTNVYSVKLTCLRCRNMFLCCEHAEQLFILSCHSLVTIIMYKPTNVNINKELITG